MFIIFMCCFLGCSQENSRSTVARLRMDSYKFALAPEDVVMLYLIDKDRAQQRSIIIDDSTYEMKLNYGNWDFVVLAWSGEDKINGNLKCGKVSQKLESEEVSIDIQVSTSGCNQDYFSPSALRNGLGTLPINFYNCSDISNISYPGQNCDDSLRGRAGHYRLRIPEFNTIPTTLLSSLSFKNVSSLISSCFSAGPAPASLTSTDLKVPYGSGMFRFPVVVESFYDSSCTIPQAEYIFPQGLVQNSLKPNQTTFQGNSASGDIYLATSDCLLNELMTGLVGRSGEWIDMLGPRCSRYEDGVFIGSAFSGLQIGGMGGDPFQEDCPTGYAISSIQYSPYGPYTSQLSFACRSVTDYSSITYSYSNYGLNSSGLQKSLDCPSPKFMRRFDLSLADTYVAEMSGVFECR